MQEQQEEPLMSLDQDLIHYMEAMLAKYNNEILSYDWSALASCNNSVCESVNDNEVRRYRPREYKVKATEQQRQQSRNYYVLHREEILIKRRLHRERLIREGRYITYKKVSRPRPKKTIIGPIDRS
jgi:hypothetical protein